MKRRAQASSIRGILALVLLVLVHDPAHGEPLDVRWSVDLYNKNSDYIVVKVDTSHLPSNVYLENVTFDASFFDALGGPLGSLRERFTDQTIRQLPAGALHVRYFEHHRGSAGKVRGGYLSWGPEIAGGKADEISSGASDARERAPCTGTALAGQHTIMHGSLPPTQAIPPGIAVNAPAGTREPTKDAPYTRRLGSLARTRFRLPEDATPNNNGSIGPFCCTGRTATITTSDGRAVGYVYFFGWKGQALSQGNTSFVPDIEILVSGLADSQNPSSPMEKSSVVFTAYETAPATKLVKAGALTYSIQLLPSQTLAQGGQVYFDMSLVRAQFEVVEQR
jgi:hypothetical protein